jgi:tetratricopeptide (TPR) repeat protein
VPAPADGGAARRRGRPPGAPIADTATRDELARAVGDRRAAKVQQQLADAARAFERERYTDARRILRPLAEQASGAAAVRELHGLTLYRLGQWRAAATELEAFRTLTGSSEQHPVLADSYRALGRYTEVEELWQELRADSPSAELVAEGRIVAAGALADQGRLAEAITLIEQAKLDVKRPKPHHLRLWYAAADLHERAGDVPRARELFERIRRHEADFADVAERLAGL